MKYLTKLLQIFLLGLLVSTSIQAATSTTYFVNDALGSPVAAMDEAGALKWRKQYKPYGEDLDPDPQASLNKIGYTGHVDDSSTGLTYMGARYYDPVVGRFMGMDSVGFQEASLQSFNRYAYANNSPYQYVDPDGKSPLSNRIYNRWTNPNQLVDAGYGAPGLRSSDSLAFREFGGFIKAPNLSAAASKGVGSRVKPVVAKSTGDAVVRTTRAGDKAVRITKSDGSVIDISPKRVKEFVLNTHPKAPPGALTRVKFDNAIPGSKGFKRQPTQQELDILKNSE